MPITVALAGNPNSGKTTMFNDLTGSTQYVGNWPGVTVEKKEGKYKGDKGVRIQDLPGIYSLSPYTPEEIVARKYLVEERPDAIINIVDGSNLERNLYLTTQLIELGIPVVIALNMIDVVRKNGDEINVKKLGEAFGCDVVETSALKGEGSSEVIEKAIERAKANKPAGQPHNFGGTLEHAIAHIEEVISDKVKPENLRFYAIKAFERDKKIDIELNESESKKLEAVILECEEELDDDSESIVINERYAYISRVIDVCLKRQEKGRLKISDKIDRIVTNRILALPIFAIVISAIYLISVTFIGAIVTDFTNDIFVGEWIMGPLAGWLEGIGVAGWLVGLIVDGIVGGVGAVIGFVPQMLVLFFLLAILEECGYMARIAFIMDRVFRRFGLSGKSFIPMLIGTGCSVPGIMASRTIESERDRRMTIITTSFIPCGAKLPVIALIAGTLFSGAWWVGPSAYFIGIIAVIASGIMLKKTKMFEGDPAPFVMELPAYHMPTPGAVLRSMWERGWSFIKKAGTIILLSSIAIWFLASFGIVDGRFMMVDDIDASIVAWIGSVIAPVFSPLGFGNWQASVAAVMGLVAKEEIVGVFGVLLGISGDALELIDTGAFSEYAGMTAIFTQLSAYAYLVFNLLCAPCFAAIGAIKREMNSAKWTWFALGYQTALAYIVAMCVYQIGLLVSGGGFTFGTAVSIVLAAGLMFLIFRPAKKRIISPTKTTKKTTAKV